MNYERHIDILQQRDYKVVKANEIIQRAKTDLGLPELKAFAYILSKVKPTDKEGQEYIFSVKDYCQVCGLDFKNGGNYDHIKKVLKKLRDTSFWLVNESGQETTVGWLGKAKINKGSGKITVKLDEDIEKYVIGLFENYTQYSLLCTLPMKSNYSFRIYELLKSYAFTGSHTFDIDDLKSKLFATGYVNFKDFRRKVIEVAVREINEYTDIEVTWEPITRGKKVIQVQFNITQRDSWGQSIALSKANEEIEGQMSLNLEEYYK